ncbi:hypothetical protein PoB_006283300 [Plakobranchus ocellatus]|uniref:Secreted protein n=1 Tax=Plakobranchus ocellatus TaxID=259542 RepID=A0AAV4CWS8_9GAST|nr:hypothetical protein PoB_006283300 [Plakobranchus ocellatus]
MIIRFALPYVKCDLGGDATLPFLLFSLLYVLLCVDSTVDKQAMLRVMVGHCAPKPKLCAAAARLHNTIQGYSVFRSKSPRTQLGHT